MDKQHLYDLLIQSLDNELDAQDQQLLENALTTSPELRTEREQLIRMRALLSESKVVASNNFTDKLLARIENADQVDNNFGASMIRMLPKVAAACFLVFLIGLVSIYLAEGNISTDSIVGVSDISPDEAYSALAENN